MKTYLNNDMGKGKTSEYKAELIKEKGQYDKLLDFVNREYKDLQERIEKKGVQDVDEHRSFLEDNFENYRFLLDITENLANLNETDGKKYLKELDIEGDVPREFMFTLTKEDKIVGYGLHKGRDFYSSVDLVFVSYSERGKGIFNVLIDNMEGFAKKFKYPHLILKAENSKIREPLRKRGYDYTKEFNLSHEMKKKL